MGAASLGIGPYGIWLGSACLWPIQLVWLADHKSAIFEYLGVILPLLVIPNQLRHRRLTLQVDNMAVVWSWRKRHMKADGLASVLIRAMHVLEAALPCRIHVEHLPRLSTPAAAAADRLTRRSTSTPRDLALLTHPKPRLPEAMQRWLHFPTLNWNLGIELAIEINK